MRRVLTTSSNGYDTHFKVLRRLPPLSLSISRQSFSYSSPKAFIRRKGYLRSFHLGANQCRNSLHNERSQEHGELPPNVEHSDQTAVTGKDESRRHLGICPGCGAFAQSVEPNIAGYYSISRGIVRKYLEPGTGTAHQQGPEDRIFEKTVHNLTSDLRKAFEHDVSSSGQQEEHPLCDRCHDLVHHHAGVPIEHPSLDSLVATVAESPWKHNHIYHVIDAADFPMSLVRNIQRALRVAPQRSRNRRGSTDKYSHGRKTEISFIVTRSDLLAPRKEQVDRLMPYLVETLRDALGASAQHVRLGNVRCVSARRGWWTKEVKADIWKRGGGGWMVGKVNVGKSNLFESVFPKGRSQEVDSRQKRGVASTSSSSSSLSTQGLSQNGDDGLLPPLRSETAYPQMPVISSLPGTTASPIRIPYGNGKGELIDLPGLYRSDIGEFVKDEMKASLIMKKRVIPEQYSVHPEQSLILGGLVRIVPVFGDVNILAYPFVPLEAHLLKDARMQEATESTLSRLAGMAKDGVISSLVEAGIFELKHDVTRQRAGPLVAKEAVGLKPDNLPFKVVSTDILIEGVGWVELVAQVRRKALSADSSIHATPSYPAVRIFSPEGRFISARRPMGAWELGKPKPEAKQKRIQPINRRLKTRRSRSSPQSV